MPAMMAGSSPLQRSPCNSKNARPCARCSISPWTALVPGQTDFLPGSHVLRFHRSGAIPCRPAPSLCCVSDGQSGRPSRPSSPGVRSPNQSIPPSAGCQPGGNPLAALLQWFVVLLSVQRSQFERPALRSRMSPSEAKLAVTPPNVGSVKIEMKASSWRSCTDAAAATLAICMSENIPS